jgi:ADP-ribose pyrophosphatase YjhB (NUDIX family)
MRVRDIDIEMRPGFAEAVGADYALSGPDAETTAGTRANEQSVRMAYRQALALASGQSARSVAISAIGTGPGGVSPVMSAKIMVQEAIRLARDGSTSVRSITMCCPRQSEYPQFERAANGYLRHFLDVLLWGPFVTVDAIIELPAGIVLVTRSNPPLGHALPGGFVDYGESLETAVRRESLEETGLELLDLAQFHTYSDPSRDPRFHTITTVFSARAEGSPRAGDDAAAVQVIPIDQMEGLHFAFDHRQVLRDWHARRAAGGQGGGPSQGGRPIR